MSEKLREPFGSPPGREAKYVLYLSRRGDDDTQCMVVIFAAPYAARKFLDVLLRDDELSWECCDCPSAVQPCECTVASSSGIVVSTRWWPKRMRRCVEHEYSLAEMAYSLDPNHVRWAKRFRNGPDLPRTLEEAGVSAERRERKPAASREQAPPGYIHVSTIAMAMGIEPKQARVALRRIYADGKPAHGWNFAPDEVEGLKAKIREQLE